MRMSTLLSWADRHSRLMVILLLFWGLFWFLNGGDKFVNSDPVPNLESWSTGAVVLDTEGEVVGEVHPVLADGWYGVSRNNKMANYFDRLGLPRGVALMSLYGLAVFEVIVGLAFLALFAYSIGPPDWQKRQGRIFALFHNRTIHRLAFKSGIFIFLLFSVGDILFGDRIELWEHGTFMVLTLVTYDLWYRTDSWTTANAEVATF
ncbi:MAG: hypothetical protein ACR2NL_00295 [Acidimicrobiia bacterium]